MLELQHEPAATTKISTPEALFTCDPDYPACTVFAKGLNVQSTTHPSIMSSSGQLLSSSGLRLGLVFWLVLGFVLVVYSAEQKYRWLIFLVVPIVI